MTGISVPDSLSFSTMSRNVADLKARADVTRNESVTGVYDDLTKHLDGDIGGAHLVKKALDDVKSYQSNLSLAAGRAESTQTALGNVNSQGNRIATNALSALGRNDERILTTTVDDARAAIIEVFSALNTTYGGRALFGGDMTDRPPLASPDQLISDVETIIAGAIDAADAEAQLDTYFNDPAGGFATSIYLGGDGRAPKVELSPGIRIDTSARADDGPIKDVIRGLVTIAASRSASFADSDIMIGDNARRALGADTLFTQLRASIGANEMRVDSAKSRYEKEEAVLNSLYADKTVRDPYEAASELQLLEARLEASYLISARMSRLTIANYLR